MKQTKLTGSEVNGIACDASTMGPGQFLRLIIGPPKDDWTRMIEHAERRGDAEMAARLLAAKNRVEAAFAGVADAYRERGDRLIRMGEQAKKLNQESLRDGGEDRNSSPADQ